MNKRKRINPQVRMAGSRVASCVMLFFFFAPCIASAKDLPKPGVDDKVELSLVVKAIEDSLTEAALNPVPNFPRLKSVTVSVNTTVSKNLGGKLTLYVFNVGAAGTVDNSSSLTFQMKPPPPPPPGYTPQSVNPEDIKNALVKQIQAAKLGFVATSTDAKLLKTNDVQARSWFCCYQGTKWRGRHRQDSADWHRREWKIFGQIRQ